MHRREAGMSLVELMVGMLIGLIGIVIITHLYVTNEQYKRSTTGSGTAQVNGAVALYTLEREIRMAGYGVNHTAALGCSCAGAGCSPLQYYYGGTYSYPPAGGAGGALPARVVAPVVITDNPGAPDSITVLYAATNERMLPAAITETTTGPDHDYKVDGVQGFANNNLIIVTQGANCVLKQISTAPSPADSKLLHRSGPAHNPASNGTLPTFSAGAAVFNLGTLTATGGPAWRTFSIGSSRLQGEDVLRSLPLLPATATQQLVDDIVDLQAQYGKDDGSVGGTTADDGVVDAWNTTMPADAMGWRRVLAIRVGVLARSPNYEKPGTAGGPCEATLAAPTWAGGAFTVPGGIPSCYKHRAFETVIPLRNMIWRPA
jgi:type IV pilus assembly protein PilW